ncbi:MAG: methyltransferase domain-containing protein [Rhodospirillales bacterium]|nr:methyltransferase domain-containing protein [Rhodospirillales bacterium]
MNDLAGKRGTPPREHAAALAEAEGHHPDVSFGWDDVTISRRTKKIKGLHENDFIVAARLDRLTRGRDGRLRGAPAPAGRPGVLAVPSRPNRYQRIAPFYDLLDLPFEFGRYRKLRPQLFEGLNGRVLDAGVGTGRNIPFYPAGAEVLGIDASAAMLARAERRGQRLGRVVALRQMDLTRLDLPDASFDAAVASFVFCVLPEPDQVPALRELRRVLRPNGQIRLLEYVRPHGRLRRAIARLWEPWMAWAYGAGFDRHTETHVAEVGLEITRAKDAVPDLIRFLELKVPAGPVWQGGAT